MRPKLTTEGKRGAKVVSMFLAAYAAMTDAERAQYWAQIKCSK